MYQFFNILRNTTKDKFVTVYSFVLEVITIYFRKLIAEGSFITIFPSLKTTSLKFNVISHIA